jgi:release factor glutamine methyltransferase
MSTLSWRQLTMDGAAQLSNALGGDRAQEARWIVERVSGYDRTQLIINAEEPVSTRAVAFCDQLFTRRCDGEPLQYVLGRWSFRTLELFVDQRVLIPRPETEIVAGLGIDFLHNRDRLVRVADLGCGSGAIGLSIVFEVPKASVWLCDVSADALAVTRANVAGLGRSATRATIAQGSWFDALPLELTGTLDLVISNPPYIAVDAVLPDDVRLWEPHVALFGGARGDEVLFEIVQAAPRWLAPGGALVLEMAPDQTEAVRTACEAVGMHASIHHDLTDKPRAVMAVLNA